MRLILFLLQKYKNHIISENNFSEKLFFFNEKLLINAKRRHYILCNTVSYYINEKLRNHIHRCLFMISAVMMVAHLGRI